METLLKIVQRFFWCLGGGCIINFFIISNYFVLTKNILQVNEFLFFINKETISEQVFFFIFIITATIIGFIIEGINEIGCQSFFENAKKMVKEEYKEKTNEIWEASGSVYKKLNLRGKVLYFIFRKATTVDVCWERFREERDDNNGKVPPESIYAFMVEHNSNAPIRGLQIWAKKIANTEKNNDVYEFRDLTFIMQILRSSFLITFLLSIIALILAIIFNGIQFLFWWYLVSIVLSLLLFGLTDMITVFFAKRYIRGVGTSYKAFELKVEKQDKNANDIAT